MNRRVFEYITPPMIKKPDAQGLLELFHRLIRRREATSYVFEGLQITFNTPIEHTTAEQQLNHYYTFIETEGVS